MPEIEKKYEKKFTSGLTSDEDFFERLEKVCKRLIYISEIDSPVTAFVNEADVDARRKDLRSRISARSDEIVREIDFGSFFGRLTAPKDWHGEREELRTRKFLDLRKLIEENLTEPKVFRIGEVHVRYVACGIDDHDRTIGVSMKALET